MPRFTITDALPQRGLKRVVGLPGAVFMGLGAIVGTGVFVSSGIAAGIAGSAMILALLLAGLVAVCNGLSSAQLAAAHPVSGGTYEYGYRYLGPWRGFFAGWLFVCAKSASAATAALGFGGYVAALVGGSPWFFATFGAVIATVLTLVGMKRTNAFNMAIVTITLTALVVYVLSSAGSVQSERLILRPESPHAFLEATALLFVAYTGYGRIATLGEEILEPKRNIPRAMIVTLAVSFVLYAAVAIVSLGTVDAVTFSLWTIESNAPLQKIAMHLDQPNVAKLLVIGAATAMFGVLLNLLLGVSRVLFAMGQRRDLPRWFGGVQSASGVPQFATLFTLVIILVLVALRDVRATWSFSAFTVLVYYSLTNFAALRLPKEDRLYPRIFAWAGLFACLGLAAWVDLDALFAGIGLLVVGSVVRLLVRRVSADV